METKEGLAHTERPAEKKIRKMHELDPDVQRQVVDRAIALLRDLLKDRKDYVIFASTAMYLNGQRLLKHGDEGGKLLITPPGDFDVAVSSEKGLEQIRQSLSRLPNVQFENGGKFSGAKNEKMRKLAGHILMPIDAERADELVAYDFEFFFHSRIVAPELARLHTIDYAGLRILSLEGLQGQYARNLQLEGQVEREVGKVTEFLTQDQPDVKRMLEEIQSWNGATELSQTAQTLLEELDITPQDMQRVLELQNQISAIERATTSFQAEMTGLLELQASYDTLRMPERVAELGTQLRQHELAVRKNIQDLHDAISERAQLLAGIRTKLWKRQLNYIQLAKLRGQNINTKMSV